MQFSIVALLAFASFSLAHVSMSYPPQWCNVPLSPVASGAYACVGGTGLSPLDPSGSDFPCQGLTPDMNPKANLTAGADAQLQLVGSAVHGGGSGQMTFTLDFPPTKDSVWYVLYSFIGDHPVHLAGNYPADPSMTHPNITWHIPPEVPSGVFVVAWDWWNRVGNREHYKKCSTVYINSQHSDRSRIQALPTAFRANSGNGCHLPENIDGIAFKNPGKYVRTAPGITPTPIDCDPSKPGINVDSSHTSGADAAPPSYGSPSPSPSSSTSTVSSSYETPIPNSSAPLVPSLVSNTTDAGTPPYDSPSSSLSPATPTTNLGYGNPSSNSTPISSPSPSTTTSTFDYGASPSDSGYSGNDNYDGCTSCGPGSAAGSGTASPPVTSETAAECVEGTFTCYPDNTWSECGSGKNQYQGKVPPGMVCRNGVFSGAKMKREVRFSTLHRLRHR